MKRWSDLSLSMKPGHEADEKTALKVLYAVCYLYLEVTDDIVVPEKVTKKRLLSLKRPENIVEASLKNLDRKLEGIPKEQLLQKFRAFMSYFHPDQVLIKLLRASSWDVPRAAALLGKILHWRTLKTDIESILSRGEIYYTGPGHDEGFIKQFKVGIVDICGRDKINRPVVVCYGRKHIPQAQSQAAVRRMIILITEEVKLCLPESTQSSILIFDLSGFGLHNMDYGAIRFLIDCVQIYYPELLDTILLHNAPRIFSDVWKIVKTWINPTMTKRIKFTRGEEDLLRLVPSDELPVELGGTAKRRYHWIPPDPEDDRLLKDVGTRYKLALERESLMASFEDATLKWVSSPNTSDDISHFRDKKVAEIAENFWASDPYCRSRSIFDRNGILPELQPKLRPIDDNKRNERSAE